MAALLARRWWPRTTVPAHLAGRWWRRIAAVLVGLAVALLPAAPAVAHEVGGVGATNFRTTLSAVTPAVPGISLRVVENGSRLELRNDTTTDVVVAGYAGEPYARVGPSGVYLNDNSPATYLNADRYSTTAVPASADGKRPPVWRRVSGEPVWRWHDHRVHWMLSSLPAAVAADPTVPHRISAWSVVLTYGDQRLTASGTLDWIPGPSPLPWIGLVVLVAGVVMAATRLARPHRVLAAAVALLLLADLVHGLGAMLVTVGTVPQRLSALFGSEALLVWPFAVFAAYLLWRRHTRAAWLGAGLGLLVGVIVLLDDAPVWWRFSAPSALPADMNRAAVALVVGLGVGLVGALPLLLRRFPVAARPWTGPAETAAHPALPDAAVAGLADGTAEPWADAGAAGADAVAGLPRAGSGIGRRQVAGYLAAGALGAFAGTTISATAAGRSAMAPGPATVPLGDVGARSIPFRGERQAGIITPSRPQAHAWVAAFDLDTGTSPSGLRDLLRRWSEAAERLMAGQPLGVTDDAVVSGLGPAALTVVVGFGPSLFGKAAVPVDARPEALAPLPAFPGERLDPVRSDGDLGVVVAADDRVVVSHTARVLERIAAGTARVRWQMHGFNTARGAGADSATPRNLMGQVDGTNNPRPSDPDFDTRVFVGPRSEPAWLRGGSYLVVRRIRMLLDEWDLVPAEVQEGVIGRRRDNGAPLTGGGERTPPDLGATAADGSLVIAPDAHIRLAAPAVNDGAALLRRGFSYVDGSEAGLLFLAWQADPRRGFIPVQRRLVAGDALGRFIRHETSALFAMPGGAASGSYLGQALVESA